MAADIDFDELDRAVNSVLGAGKPAEDAATSVPVPIPAPAATPAAPVALVTDVPPQPVDDSAVSVTVNVKKPEPVAPQIIEPPKPPVAPRPNSGRFMDMVHSTSEMKSPLRGGVVNNAAPAAPVVPAPSAPAVQSQLPTEDPNQPSADDLPAGAPPQDSPFVSSAQVQKRPLGAFSDSTTPEGGINEHGPLVLKPLSADVKPEPLPEKPLPPADPKLEEPSQPAAEAMSDDTPLPAELQSAVLSLESDGSSVQAPAEPVKIEPVEPAKPEKPAELEKPASPHEEILSKLPGSIAQQYREKAVTETPASGAIFDTQDYHKPLAAKSAKKKMPTWLVYTLWGLALVVVGGGAGYAIYFYVLPMIQG